MKSFLCNSWLTKEPSSSPDATKIPNNASRGSHRRAASSSSFDVRLMLHPSSPSIHNGKVSKDSGWVDRLRPTAPLELLPTRKSSLKSSPPRLNHANRGRAHSFSELGERRRAQRPRSSSLRLPAPDHSRSPPAPCIRPRPPRSTPPKNAARSSRRVRFCTPEETACSKDSRHAQGTGLTQLEDVKEEDGEGDDCEFDPLEMYGYVSEDVQKETVVSDSRCHAPPILGRQETPVPEELTLGFTISEASSSDTLLSTEEIVPKRIPSLRDSQLYELGSKFLNRKISVYDSDSFSSSSLPDGVSPECTPFSSAPISPQIIPSALNDISDGVGDQHRTVTSMSGSDSGVLFPLPVDTSQPPHLSLQTLAEDASPSEPHLPTPIDVNPPRSLPIAINLKRSRSGSGSGALVPNSYISKSTPIQTNTRSRSSSRERSRTPPATSSMLKTARAVTPSLPTPPFPSDSAGSQLNPQASRKCLPLPYSVTPARRPMAGAASTDSLASSSDSVTSNVSKRRSLTRPEGLLAHLPKTRSVAVLNFEYSAYSSGHDTSAHQPRPIRLGYAH